MTLRPALALALAVLAAPAGAGGLTSLTDRSHILGWEAVGRLDGERGHCTAVLIAPDLVLTAAHCMFEPDTNTRRDPTELVFRAGYRDGETIAESAVARAVVPEAYDNLQKDFLKFLVSDVALLELADPIPSTTAAPYAVTGPGEAGDSVTVVSFGRSRMNAASRESGCSVTAAGRGAIVFDCEGEPGSSGAPVFDTSGYAPRIMALISSVGNYKGQAAVFGMDLPEAVSGLKQQMRSGRGVWPMVETPAAKRLARKASDTRGAGGARFLKP